MNHRYQPDEDEWMELSGYYRRNSDDYDFNRFAPEVGNPFIHEVKSGGGAVKGRVPVGGFGLRYGAEIYADEIDSTALTFGPHDSQVYGSVSLAADRTWEATGGEWTALLGAHWDESNRVDGILLPVSRLEYARRDDSGDGWTLYADASGASQVAGYTALASSPTAGLFRGNPDLDRETSWNLTLGGGTDTGPWSLDAAAFVRRDEDLTDWTFQTDGSVARTANPVDLWVYGLEFLGRYGWEDGRISLGYAWLGKDEDFGNRMSMRASTRSTIPSTGSHFRSTGISPRGWASAPTPNGATSGRIFSATRETTPGSRTPPSVSRRTACRVRRCGSGFGTFGTTTSRRCPGFRGRAGLSSRI